MMKYLIEYGLGIIFVGIISIIAAWLGNIFPLIGGPVIGILMGIFISNTLGKPLKGRKGILFTSKKVLQWSIVLLGSSLSFTHILATGIESLSIMLFTLAAAFLAAYGLGYIMGIPYKLTTLIGVGTAICGGSAIAAISPIIDADESDIAYAISTIFLFNILAVLIFPPLGHLLNFSNEAFGIWAGTAINDTSSVVAAGYAFSNEAGTNAVIVKLTRTTMIIPIAFVYSLLQIYKRKKTSVSDMPEFKKVFPWFILWFLGASALNTFGLLDEQFIIFSKQAAKFMIIMALTAIGLNADLKKMFKTGTRPLILGLLIWLTVTLTSIIVLLISKQLVFV